MLKKLVVVVAAVVVVASIWRGQETPSRAAAPAIAPPAAAPVEAPRRAEAAPRTAPEAPARSASNSLEHAIATRAHDAHVTGAGVVTRLLRDDLSGARHQRFLIRTDSGHSLLVAYNIDIAPRILALKTGGQLSFEGEYVWNDRGGLIHWTHRDPAHRHPDGYIRYDGHVYR